MTRTEQIREALEVLSPPSDRHNECRRDIEHALDIMASTVRAVEAIKAQRAANRQTGRGYHAALKRALATSKAHARAGGALAISIASLERIVASATEWDVKVSRRLPKGAIAERQGTALAYFLLQQWDRPTLRTRGGAWHKLAAILIGDRKADLFRHLCEFKPELS